MVNPITEYMDIWTSAQMPKKTNGGRGRASNGNGQGIYGIKKLRELILELAVRGKLVPQDPEDEPASVLLEKISEEKKRLVKEGKIKKQKGLPDIKRGEKPFELPQGWEWTRLGFLGICSTGKTPSTSNPNYYKGSIPFIGPGQITIDNDILDSEKKLTVEGCEYSAIAGHGDILMVCIGGSIGKSAVVQSKIAFNQQINCISPLIIASAYLYIAVNSMFFQTSISNIATGSATPIINRSKWENLLIELPPLPEQHRIVAKVDELMALCDQLEQQQIDRNDTHQTLVETLLTTLTSAADPKEFADTWQRIADHFDILFTTEQSIDQLKQTILQLAVMGKLVPQDPNDEPASVLLEKIAEEKKRLVKEGKIKKQKALPEIGDDEKPFELPDGWEWCRVWDVSELITSGSRGWAKYYSNKGAIFVTMGNLSRDNYNLRMETIRYVNPPEDGEGSRTKLEENDLLISITVDVGNLGLVPPKFGEAYINQHTCLVRFVKDCQNRYFPEVLRSPLAKQQFNAPQRGIKNSFRLGDVGEMMIPIAPKEEQHRIVAKIGELMTICDDLKARLNENQNTQVQLADAIVEKAVAVQ